MLKRYKSHSSKKMIRTLTTLLMLCAAAQSVALSPQVNPEQPASITGPIPVTEHSYPFLQAGSALDNAGYVEEEYFLSGQAKVYDWHGKAHDIKVVAGPGPYTTRLLVRRPKNPADFSGNIEVKVLNATRGYDFGTFTDFEAMTQQGDAWIGITSKAINANALQRFDPQRYATLNWASPVAQHLRCERPSFYPAYMVGDSWLMKTFARTGLVPLTSWPETEDGLVWDMLGQLALLLKSEQRDAILPGFGKPRLFMTGISQSSILIRTWLAAFHSRYRTAEGEPLYDGYLAIVGPALARLNQCSTDIALDDPRQQQPLPDVPFISLSAEGEEWISRHTLQADAFSETGGIVSYEVTGASHRRLSIPGSHRLQVGIPSERDVEKAASDVRHTGIMEAMILGFRERTDFPWDAVVRAAYENLKRWAIDGIKPPQAKPLSRDADGNLLRDRYGNALGGVRLPYVEVPVAAYRGNVSAGGLGALLGTRKPLPEKVLRELYPEQDTFTTNFERATARMVEQRWLLPPDAAAMNAAARTQQKSIARQ